MDVGLSQRKLANQLGVSRSSVENWERRGVEPARWMVPKISEFLGLQPPETTLSLGENLTAYRRFLGVSQEELARALGVH